MVATIATPSTIKISENSLISKVDTVKRSCNKPKRRTLKILLNKNTKSGLEDCAVTTNDTGPKLTDNIVRKIANGTTSPSFNKIILKLLRVLKAVKVALSTLG